jgi:multidrug resistance efflux pump
VSADLSGTVDRVAFDSGKAVRRGDVLVELDTRQERAQLAAAEAQSDLARTNFDRMQGLLKTTSSPAPNSIARRQRTSRPLHALARSGPPFSASSSPRRSPGFSASGR